MAIDILEEIVSSNVEYRGCLLNCSMSLLSAELSQFVVIYYVLYIRKRANIM